MVQRNLETSGRSLVMMMMSTPGESMNSLALQTRLPEFISFASSSSQNSLSIIYTTSNWRGAQ